MAHKWDIQKRCADALEELSPKVQPGRVPPSGSPSFSHHALRYAFPLAQAR
jgi:hypothetical protein